MTLFNPGITTDDINKMGQKSMVGYLGIEITEIGQDFIKGKMPVDDKTRQPYGMLHGGASVVLAESLGSLAATFTVDQTKQYCVGLDINANHIRAVKEGYVYGVTTPLHIGRSTQVWETKITNEEEKLVCVSRITMAVIDIKK